MVVYRDWLIRGAFIAFAILIVVIAFYFSLQYFIEDKESSSGGTTFYPNDTRLLSYLHPLCQGMTLSIGKDKYSYVASIYVLKSVPTLVKQPNFNFVAQPNSSNGYVDYKFHFYPGTDLNVSACDFLNSSTAVTFYMLEGDAEFNELVHSKVSKSKNKFEISENCEQGNITSHRFKVVSEDIYHLVFYTEESSLKGINASLTISQVQHNISRDDVISSCSVITAGEPCSVGVPFTASATLLTFTSAATNWVPYDDNLMFSCTSRIWMGLVISLGSTLLIVILILLIAGILYACIACTRRPTSNSYHPGDKTPLMRETPQKRTVSSPDHT